MTIGGKQITVSKIINFFEKKYLDLYFWYYPKYKIRQIRNQKEQIRVIFVLCDLSTWKTENLYLAMLKHDRFDPVLAITRNTNLLGHEKKVCDYLASKGYQYITLDENRTITEQLRADLVCYQRPYNEEPEKHWYTNNRRLLNIYIHYGFHSIIEKWNINGLMPTRSWQYYFENELCATPYWKMSRFHGRNILVTGTPFMDSLSQPSTMFQNPWKNNDNRKRIIWAPHHTIGDVHMRGVAYGTFLDIADQMLNVAEQYKDKVCFAFKPHPQLTKSLSEVWDQERIANYYNRWKTMENSQYENGEYMGLFKYSDAMIHDCSSFINEYMATGKPVLYLIREDHSWDNVDECTQRSFKLHYQGQTIDDIRSFIDNVIAGQDERKDERMQFVNQFLRPPHGKTACENIMNAILGVEEYKLN